VSAFRKLSGADARWHAIHARMRDVLRQALADRLRGRSQLHVAQGIRDALNPASPRRAEWEAELSRREASGLIVTTTAQRRAAFADYQRRRATARLRDAN
jgi:hypothetical protein